MNIPCYNAISFIFCCHIWKFIWKFVRSGDFWKIYIKLHVSKIKKHIGIDNSCMLEAFKKETCMHQNHWFLILILVSETP